ncbi:MAG: hypothetical protein HY744_29615 [Deltaproteobacteria bacterium]|nr:hypothetical protein [Deltaproteobacteria bacterium]
MNAKGDRSRAWLAACGLLLPAFAATSGCGNDDNIVSASPDCCPDGGVPQGGAGGAGGTGDAGGGGGAAGEAPAPVYGIFQLYGDEYTKFRELMGFSLEEYWAFVDEHVAKLDVRFTRTNTLLIWGMVEPTLGAGYKWNTPMKTDQVIRATYAPAEGKRMDILLVIEPTHGEKGTPPYPTGLEKEYQQFVRAAVARYNGDGKDDVDEHVRVKHWQVMNEPFFELKSGSLSAQQYADLVKLTAEAVREVDPEARIVLGDTAEHTAKIVPLLAGGGYFDAVDTHYWSAAQNGYQPPPLPKLRQVLDEGGYASAEIWMCELGTHRNKPDQQPPQTAEEQARWLVKAMVANRAAGVSRILWNNLVPWINFMGQPGSWYNFMGLISTGEASGDAASELGKPVTAYHSYARLIAKTDSEESVLVGEQPVSAKDGRLFAFEPRGGGERFYVAWSDGSPATIELPLSGPAAEVSSLVPDEGGKFLAQNLEAKDGKVAVDLGADPMLVEPVPGD